MNQGRKFQIRARYLIYKFNLTFNCGEFRYRSHWVRTRQRCALVHSAHASPHGGTLTRSPRPSRGAARAPHGPPPRAATRARRLRRMHAVATRVAGAPQLTCRPSASSRRGGAAIYMTRLETNRHSQATRLTRPSISQTCGLQSAHFTGHHWPTTMM